MSEQLPDVETGRERLDGHEPILIIESHQKPKFGCICGPLNNRPFMWHVMDVLRTPAPNPRDARVAAEPQRAKEKS